MEKCACFYFDVDVEAAKETDDIIEVCYCGHVDDEHDDDGECQAHLLAFQEGRMELGMSEYQLGVKVHRCGAVVQDGEKFCASCGWPLMNIPDDIKTMSDMLDTVIASVKGADTSVLGLAHAAYVMGWEDAIQTVRSMDLLAKPIATKAEAKEALTELRARQETAAAEEIQEFYGADGAPLPDGVVPAPEEGTNDDD